MRLPILAALLIPCAALPAAAQEATLYSTDFSSLDGWTVIPGWAYPLYSWHVDAGWLGFNNGFDIGDDVHARTSGQAVSDPIDLSAASGVPHLRFLAGWNGEAGCDYDVLSLRVLSASSGAVLFQHPCFDNGQVFVNWTAFEFPLDRTWGEVRIRFEFDTIDHVANWGIGPFIDDLSVVDVLPVVGIPFCSGDGSGTACPCANAGAAGAGCANSTGAGAGLIARGTASVSAGDLVLSASPLSPFQFGTFIQGEAQVNGGAGVTFGDGLRCVGGALVRLQQVQSDVSGESSSSIDIAMKGGVAPGDTRTYQLWYRDPVGSPCGTFFNLSNGLEVTWLP